MLGDKSKAYELYYRGAFGNKLRTWDSYDALKRSGYKGLVTIRYKQSWSRFLKYNIPVEDLARIIAESVHDGADPRLLTFNEAAPDDHIILQGEYMNADGDEWLFCSLEKTRMRQALQSARHIRGIAARLILKEFMTPSSYEDFLALCEKYPNHVIELSIYDINLGVIPGRNTIFWEARDT